MLLNNRKFEEAIMLSTAGDVSLCHNGLRGQSFSYRIEALEYMTDSNKAELIGAPQGVRLNGVSLVK